MTPPRKFSALPPQDLYEASPKAISRRTSYLRVRLEFLRYPQVIRSFFNRSRFGPPHDFTHASSCPWIGHSVSGRISLTFRAFHTRFPCGSGTEYLNLATYNNSPDRSTKSTTSRLNALCLLVNTRFQVLFTPLPGSFSPFPHGTSPLSVTG